MSAKLLFVDDDPNVLTFYEDYFQRGFCVDTALDGEAALNALREHGPYAVIIADMNMPEMNGIELLMRAKEVAPETVRIMITADTEQQTAMRAINQGHIFQFLTKPCPPDVLLGTVQNGIRQYQLIVAEREVLEQTLNGSIKVLTDILSMVEPHAFGQGQKVRDRIRSLVQFLGLVETWELEIAAMLCQIGYVTIPATVVQKLHANATLSQVEKGLLTRVPEFGHELLNSIPRLQSVAKMIYFQDKNFDGTGFPFDQEVNGEEIPLGSRLLRIITDMVELESKGATKVQALTQLKQRAGCYDPKLLETALSCFISEKQGRAVAMKDLRVGHVLLSSIETLEGVLVVPAGTRISPLLLKKLDNFTELSAIKEPIFVEGEG